MEIHVAFNLIVLLVFLLAFYRIISSGKNKLEFWHFLSSKSVDGVYHSDLDKLGQIVGLLVSTWVIVWLTYRDLIVKEWTGVAVFAAWLIYASGMGAFSKWARAFISSRYGAQHARPQSEAPAAGAKP